MSLDNKDLRWILGAYRTRGAFFQAQILGGDLRLANLGPEVFESSCLCWRLGALQFRAQEFWEI